MAKNTGMNAKDEKAGKTTALAPKKAAAINKLLVTEEAQNKKNPPTKTVALVEKARAKKQGSQKTWREARLGFLIA